MLFDAAFLNSLQGLRIVARRVPRGGRHADQRSLDLGSGIEFRDFRAYTPGDDFRAIDWNIYRRLGRVFLRLFEELEDLPLYLMPDVSDSMFHEDPPRAHAALRTTLALAAISLNQHDPVGVFPFGEDLVDQRQPKAGKRHVVGLANYLAERKPSGPTDLVASLRSFSKMRRRPGLLVIVSDFFDPAGVEAIERELRRLRHKLLLVQVARPSDRQPSLEGDMRLIDCETRVGEDVTITPAVLERYRAAYDRFSQALADCAGRRGAGLLRLDADGDIVQQLAGLFEGGRYVA